VIGVGVVVFYDPKGQKVFYSHNNEVEVLVVLKGLIVRNNKGVQTMALIEDSMVIIRAPLL
jgi:hypothetical protein